MSQQTFARDIAIQIVQPEHAAVGPAVPIIAGSRQHGGAQGNQRRKVTSHRLKQRGVGPAANFGSHEAVDRGNTARAGANHQFLRSLPIEFRPRYAWGWVGQTPGQQSLTLEVVEDRVLGDLIQPRREISKKRFGNGWGSRRGSLGGFRHFHLRLRRYVGNHQRAPGRPAGFDGKELRRSRGKHPHRIVTAQVASPRHEHLRLFGERARPNQNASPQTAGITARTAGPNQNTRGRGFIPEQRRRRVEIVLHHVQIAIAVEITQGHAMGNVAHIEAPLRRYVREREITPISKGHVRHGQPGKQLSQVQQLPGIHPPLILELFRLLNDIRIHHVELVPVGNQQIFPTVQIHIEKDRRPRPFAGRHTRQASHFGIRAVAPAQEQRVLRELLTLIAPTRFMATGRKIIDLLTARLVIPTQHVQHQKIAPAIPVYIRGIGAHGKRGRMAQGARRSGAKPQGSPGRRFVEPKAVRRLEIVAQIQVRPTIIVEVTKKHTESPIVRRRNQGLSRFVEKRAAGPAHRNKLPRSFVQEEGIGFTVLLHPGRRHKKTTNQVWLRCGPTIVRDDPWPGWFLAQGEFPRGIIANGVRPVVHHVEIQIPVPLSIGGGETRSRPSGI